MRRSNCSAPILPPPGHPRGHHFFGGCPGLLITLFFPCPALYKHSNHSFFQCPALIDHTHFSSDPEAALGSGGRGQNNLTGALFFAAFNNLDLFLDWETSLFSEHLHAGAPLLKTHHCDTWST